MKRLLLISTFVVLVAGPAMAADQAVRVYKRPRPVVLAAPVYNWTGFYVGGNAGYGVGTNNSTTGSFTQAGSASYSDDDGPVIFPIAGGGSTLSGDRPIQSGFLGGAQFGYNYQLYPTVIIGIETDFQGSSIRGSGAQAGSLSASSASFLDQDAALQTEQFVQNGLVQQHIQAGIDWLGTIRARAGFLITPSFLTFVTGGFTYGGADANINLSSTQAATLTGEDFILPSVPMTTQTFLGSGSASRVLEGWNVGAGFEWIFMPNWSVKGEALYWNLGKLDVTTTASSAGLPQFLPFEAGESAFLNPALLVGRHSVTFQGVIIRAGLNYHFSSYYAPIVTK